MRPGDGLFSTNVLRTFYELMHLAPETVLCSNGKKAYVHQWSVLARTEPQAGGRCNLTPVRAAQRAAM